MEKPAMVTGPGAAASGSLAKAGAMWTGWLLATLGVNSWSEAASMASAFAGFAAFAYSILLCIGWCWRFYHKVKAARMGPPPDTTVKGDLTS